MPQSKVVMDVIQSNGVQICNLTGSYLMLLAQQLALYVAIQISNGYVVNEDIAQLAQIQKEILHAIWPYT